MKLVITTPTRVLGEFDDVVHVRAEDETGAFGILPGHADFLSVLIPSVVSWRTQDGLQGHCAVRGGVFTVAGGEDVSVATREGVIGDDLDTLEDKVVNQYRRSGREEEQAKAGSAKLHLAALRQICTYLRPQRRQGGPGMLGRANNDQRGRDRS